MQPDPWEAFLGFSSRGAAEVVAAILEAEGVPTQLLAGNLAAGLEVDFVLAVPASLRHRARWLLAQPDFEEAELVFLATGTLQTSD